MKDIPTSPRITQIKRKRKVGRIRLIVLSTILFVSIIVALSYLSFDKRLSIKDISINGTSIINWDEVSKKIEENLSGKYLYLFSKRNSLIYPHDKIQNSLLVEFPRIEKIDIKVRDFNTLILTVKERLGSYLYCGEVLPEKKEEIGENCFFVNNDGYIFDKAPYFSGDIYFKYYTEINKKDNRVLGSQIFEADRFHKLARFVDGVTSLGFKPIYLVKSKENNYSLYLKGVGDKPNPKVIFKEDNDLITILDNLKTAMGKKEFANEINGGYDTLSYIDLRFKNKVLYKFQ
ncbi:hypothetical protein HXX01_02145 [Candidatus Nomurabacteria bacterium]|nr:hypothetical protein [Candidatus Nomurabacteria bacterium]